MLLSKILRLFSHCTKTPYSPILEAKPVAEFYLRHQTPFLLNTQIELYKVNKTPKKKLMKIFQCTLKMLKIKTFRT